MLAFRVCPLYVCAVDFFFFTLLNSKTMETVMTGTIKKLGRKPLTDKKMVVRVFIQASIIKANGGEESCKKKCVDFLTKEATKKSKK